MRRRDFIGFVGGAAALPFATRAQSAKIARIGFLGAASASGWASKVEAFRAGLRDLGYVEGKNIVIEYRWAEGRYERLPELAAELVRQKVDVLVTQATPGVRAAKQATTTIPIVIAAIGDAIAAGVVTSLARPGGNVTGSSFFSTELAAKRLDVLKETLPQVKRVGVLFNTEGLYRPSLGAMAQGIKALDIELQQYAVRETSDLPGVFQEIAKGRNEALVMNEDPMLLGQFDSDCGISNAAAPPHGWLFGNCQGWWPDRLRRRHRRNASSRSRIRRQDPQRR
jgi:putative ABC transport system substrate-binding protein